jgi:hypothetical protein
LRCDDVLGHHVHHRNHYGPDNRAENLLTLTPREHALGLHGTAGFSGAFHARFTPDLGLVEDARGGRALVGSDEDWWHTTPEQHHEVHSHRPDRPSVDHPHPPPEASPLSGYGLRRDAQRHADAIVHLLRLTERPWSISELATIISMQEGSLRRLLARICGLRLVAKIDGNPTRYVAPPSNTSMAARGDSGLFDTPENGGGTRANA